MVHAAIFASLIFAVLFPAVAVAQTSCLPGYAALQTLEIIENDTHFNRALVSQNSSGEFKTRVVLEGRAEHGHLKLKIQFDPAFEGVSLPYNLYAVMVMANGEPVGWYDYTRACSGSGLSFFPGKPVDLPPVKLPGGPSPKVQIMVWGKL